MLEARPRVGGRVWSQTLPNGAVVEMGAEFILPGNTAILELVERFGLGLWDKGMRYGRRDPRGGIGTTHEELAAAMRDGRRRSSRAERTAGASAEDFLDSIDIPAGAREAILARVEISCANTADRVAAADLAGVGAHRRRAVRRASPAATSGWRSRWRPARRRPFTWRSRSLDPVGPTPVRGATTAGAVEADALRGRRARERPRRDRVRAAAAGRLRARARAASSGTATPPSCSCRSGRAAPAQCRHERRRSATGRWTATGDGGGPQPVVSASPGRARARRGSTSPSGPEPLARLARAGFVPTSTSTRAAPCSRPGRRPVGGRGLLDLAATARGRRRRHRPARWPSPASTPPASSTRSWRARSGAGGARLGSLLRA